MQKALGSRPNGGVQRLHTWEKKQVNSHQTEVIPFLDAHVRAVNSGLQALLDLLEDAPEGKTVQAASMRVLLQPLADEASQAEPLARLLTEEPT